MRLRIFLAIGALLSATCFAEVSYAFPGGNRGTSRSNFSASRRGFGSGRGSPIDTIRRNTFTSTVSVYSGLSPHEQAAAHQVQAQKAYEDQLQAIKEGRYVPPKTGSSKDPAAVRAALDEQRAQREQILAQRRLDRQDELSAREAAHFARTKKGMELQRKQTARSENSDHRDVDPAKLQEQLNGEAETDGLKNF